MHDMQEKSLSSIYSSNELAELSVPSHRAELFLERLANLDCSDKRKVQTFEERFEDLLPAHEARLMFVQRLFDKDANFLRNRIQAQLRSIWKEPAPLLKKSGIMVLAASYMKECELSAEERTGDPAEEIARMLFKYPDKFLTVLIYAVEHVHLLRYCANPECKEPYFVARRGSQVYCSSPCAKPAQVQAKLKWWREHGNERRRKAQRKRRKHAKTKKA